MLGALELLLGVDRLFEVRNPEQRLPAVMEQSRKDQNEVSTRLAEQVLEALWICCSVSMRTAGLAAGGRRAQRVTSTAA